MISEGYATFLLSQCDLCSRFDVCSLEHGGLEITGNLVLPHHHLASSLQPSLGKPLSHTISYHPLSCDGRHHNADIVHAPQINDPSLHVWLVKNHVHWMNITPHDAVNFQLDNSNGLLLSVVTQLMFGVKTRTLWIGPCDHRYLQTEY